ncbi:MAG: AAA family ATPase [Lachnospiraceae bacterium]|nr:AAA family ATPase [Lachnospiraceae bacterium]
MQKKNLKEIYEAEGVNNCISKITPQSKSSSISKEDSKIMYQALDFEKASDIGNDSCIIHKTNFGTVEEVKRLLKKGTKPSYVKLVSDLCKNDDAFELIKKANWFHNGEEIAGKEDRYAYVDRDNCYIYTDANRDFLLERAIRIIIDAKQEEELENYYYVYTSKEDNINEMKTQMLREQKGAGLADEDVETVHYWIYSPGNNAYKWDDFYKRGVMGLGWCEIGDYSKYSSKEEMKAAMQEKIDPNKSHKNAAYATWQFLMDMKPGDIVFVKKGMHTVIAKGVVTSDYIYDTQDEEYPNIREVNWTHVGERVHPGQAVMKTLTDITPYTEYVSKLNALYEDELDEDVDELEPIEYPPYSPEKFLEEVYMSSDDYDTLVELIRIKKNVILQGAPGVGKTYAAKRLAYSMMGCKDQNRVMLVQFHQSYTYEDFVEGFRPASSGDGFEIKKGAFYKFCKRAADDIDNEYFFIIDEINRGNLSKIFGELFMLVENDKRGNALRLLYSGDDFYVPKNVYIIGMMNTADRSLAMLDYALRRRFAFFDMKPGFESDGFRKYRLELDNNKFNRLIDCIEALNNAIESDDSLGEGFCIGHSYFCEINAISDKILSNIVEYEIIPLLKEYWYDETIKVKDWSEKLRSSIK